LLCLFSPLVFADFNVSLGYSNYITDTAWEEKLNNYMDLSIQFEHYDNINSSWFYGTDVFSSSSLDSSNQHYIAVSDIFLGYKLDSSLNCYNFSFVLGRQKSLSNKPNAKDLQSLESWSLMDDFWDLGLWESRVHWDYLQPKKQGLAGAFFTVEQKSWLLTIFLSGLFFPDNTLSVDIIDGKVRSKSRWFFPPQSEFTLFNQRIEAFYFLQKPYLKNVLLNDSVAIKFRFGDPEDQWLSMAYAYKPVNQVYFKVDGRFSIDKTAVDSVIYYQSFKHFLASIDFGIKKKALKFIFSVTQEVPNRPKTPTDWIAPILPKALFLSSHLEINFEKYQWPIKLLKLNGIYTRFIGPESGLAFTNPELTLDMNINRFKLYQGFSVSAHSKEFQWFSQSFSLDMSYWYSLPEQGGWLYTSFNWQISSALYLKTSLDILGSDIDRQGFFNSYKQNDRVAIKLIYNIN